MLFQSGGFSDRSSIISFPLDIDDVLLHGAKGNAKTLEAYTTKTTVDARKRIRSSVQYKDNRGGEDSSVEHRAVFCTFHLIRWRSQLIFTMMFVIQRRRAS